MNSNRNQSITSAMQLTRRSENPDIEQDWHRSRFGDAKQKKIN
jgi:hypothetical protein